MTHPPITAAEIDRIVARFVGGEPFMAFWRAFMDALDAFDDAALAPEQAARFEELYELVYMGQPDPVAPEDYAVGLRGERELRDRLRDFRLDTGGEAAV